MSFGIIKLLRKTFVPERHSLLSLAKPAHPFSQLGWISRRAALYVLKSLLGSIYQWALNGEIKLKSCEQLKPLCAERQLLPLLFRGLTLCRASAKQIKMKRRSRHRSEQSCRVLGGTWLLMPKVVANQHVGISILSVYVTRVAVFCGCLLVVWSMWDAEKATVSWFPLSVGWGLKAQPD